jgi:hypothetical protein
VSLEYSPKFIHFFCLPHLGLAHSKAGAMLLYDIEDKLSFNVIDVDLSSIFTNVLRRLKGEQEFAYPVVWLPIMYANPA